MVLLCLYVILYVYGFRKLTKRAKRLPVINILTTKHKLLRKPKVSFTFNESSQQYWLTYLLRCDSCQRKSPP